VEETFPVVPGGGNPLKAESPEAKALPGVVLEFLNGTRNLPPYRLNRILTLMGQAPICKLRLISSTVSRFHGSLLRTEHGLWVIDLLRRGGILVGGRSVPWARLDDGDQFQVGKFSMRVRYDRPQAKTVVPTALTSPTMLIPAATMPSSGLGELKEPAAALVASMRSLPSLSGFDLTAFPISGRVGASLSTFDTGIIQSIVLPLAQQFSQMQQQMFDQFQQSLVAMAQMFSGLHKEQVGLIRQELDRLNELTGEIQTLEARLAVNQSALCPLPLPPPVGEDNPSMSPLGSDQPSAPPTRSPAADNSTAPAASADAPRSAAKEAADGPGDAARNDGGPEKKPPGAAPGHSDKEVHLWLAQRLAAIQEEQQSRWRRILNFLWGKGE
jgi:hypothetical protein